MVSQKQFLQLKTMFCELFFTLIPFSFKLLKSNLRLVSIHAVAIANAIKNSVMQQIALIAQPNTWLQSKIDCTI